MRYEITRACKTCAVQNAHHNVVAPSNSTRSRCNSIPVAVLLVLFENTMSAEIRITPPDEENINDTIVASAADGVVGLDDATVERPNTSAAPQQHQLQSLSAVVVSTDADRNLPRRRRKSQSYTHSCSNLYKPQHSTMELGGDSGGDAVSAGLGGSTNSVHRVASGVTATAAKSTISSTRDRSVPNVNFYIPDDPDGHRADREDPPYYRARCNLNLNLKNVCQPERRDSHAMSSIGSEADGGNGTAATNDEDVERSSAPKTNGNDEGGGGGVFSWLMRWSWSEKFRQWRNCLSGNELDKSTTRSARNREASVASVLPTEKSQQSTSSRILRAFSHVGERKWGRLIER